MPIQLDPEGHEITALVELLPNLHESRVVEVGCGDGRLTRRYAARAGSVLAFDPDEVSIAAVRSDPPAGDVELRTATVESVDIPEGSADVVLLSWALWWLPLEGMVDALDRARRWLKRGGCLIDLRPAHTIPEVVVGADEDARVVGVLTVEAERHQRHAAADGALRHVLDRQLFVLEEAREFVFHRYADSAEELRDYIAERWKQTRLDDATCLRTAAALDNDAGARLWLRERVAIRRLKRR